LGRLPEDQETQIIKRPAVTTHHHTLLLDTVAIPETVAAPAANLEKAADSLILATVDFSERESGVPDVEATLTTSSGPSQQDAVDKIFSPRGKASNICQPNATQIQVRLEIPPCRGGGGGL